MSRAAPSPTSIYAAATAGIAVFSVMDMVMKALVLDLGTYPTLLWRSLAGTIAAAGLMAWYRPGWPGRAAVKFHVLRGVVSAAMALLFFWGLARVPMAQAVALTFIAPLIALVLAAVVLHEKLGARVIGGSLLALAGVGVIVAGQVRAPAGPHLLAGSAAVLGSAVIYAWNIVLMRQQALVARPVEIAFFQNLTVAGSLLLILPLSGGAPVPHGHWAGLALAVVLAIVSQLTLAWAYARAGAAYLSSSEYSSFLWAMLLGWLYFREPVAGATLAGAGLITVGCLAAARSRQEPGEAAQLT